MTKNKGTEVLRIKTLEGEKEKETTKRSTTNTPLNIYIYMFKGESGHLLFATQHSEKLNDKGHLTSLVKWKGMIPGRGEGRQTADATVAVLVKLNLNPSV